MSADPTTTELRFHHGGVSVPNLEEAIAWYQQMLGFEVELAFPIPQIPASVAIIKRGALRFELFEVPNANPLPEDRRFPDRDNRTIGNKHVAFAVADVGPPSSSRVPRAPTSPWWSGPARLGLFRARQCRRT